MLFRKKQAVWYNVAMHRISLVLLLSVTLLMGTGCRVQSSDISNHGAHGPETNYTATVRPGMHANEADAQTEGTIAWHLQKIADAGGGTITLTAGDYTVEESLVLPDHTRLVGDARKSRIIGSAAITDHLINNTYSDRLKEAGVIDIEISGITLIGKRDVRKNCIQLVAANAEPSNGITLRDLEVHDCGRHGIHVKGAQHVRLQHITAYDNGVNIDHDHNIYLLRTTNATVDDITTYGAAGNGLSSTRLQHARLQDIQSTQNGKRGIRFGGGVDIRLQHCKIAGNSVAPGREADGIIVVSDDFHNQSANIRIEQCVITDNKGSGIFVSWAQDITIQHNTFSGNGKEPITVEKSDVTERDNTVE
jgi:parallel beta-helix repeat protein